MNDVLLSLFTVFSIAYCFSIIANFSQESAEKKVQMKKEAFRKAHLALVTGKELDPELKKYLEHKIID